ncbi:MAG: DNA gyrase subunit A, partial [Candidatus Pacebacteria bacterium]|nr:DNA gyrase subunit A [Candidatus Paceibacterota bacterium]
LIKASKDAAVAHKNLMKEFKFSDKQATAILEMRLQKLAGLERKKIEDDLKATQELISELEGILKSAKKVRDIIKKELKNIADTYGDDRRTKVIPGGVKEISVEDLVPNEENALVLTSGGYVKRTSPNEFKKQKRGGVGVVDINTKEEDFVVTFLSAETHDDILFFTDKGKVYKIKMYDLPEGKRATRGKSIMNFISLEADEKVTSVLPMSGEMRKKDVSILMVTEKGTTKKVQAESFHDVRRSGIIAIKLANDDTLVSAQFAEKDDTAVIVTKKGQSIRFDAGDVREMGRSAAGVRGIKISKEDSVVSSGIVPKEFAKTARLLVMTENGYGKATPIDEYKVQNRGGSGIKTAKIGPKTGDIIGARVLTNQEELVTMSKKSQVIRVETKEIPSLGRQTQGVRVMKLRSGDALVALICL